MNRNSLQALRSKKDIEVAFVRLIEDKGFNKLTVKDICSTALIGRSTFYRYYEDKYDLLEKLIVQYTQLLDKLLTTRMSKKISDDLLADLYNGLAQYDKTILSLLKVSVDDISLSKSFKEVLEGHLATYLSDFTFELPERYIQELYATNVMTAITWALKYGVDQKIVSMMNDTFCYLTEKYTVKTVK